MNLKNRKSSFVNHKSLPPQQYIQGFTEFYKLQFKVTADVLIPRPETELLVDAVIEFSKNKPVIILDIGTGSGNIAISLAKNLPQVKIIATDLSQEALEIAKENAQAHGVVDQITFIKSDLLSDIEPLIHSTNSTSLIIITNLPYIPTDRINYLDSSVKDFEPFMALDGGKDGFELYRQLFAQINQKGLKPKLVIGEIDYTHAETALQEAQKYFPKAEVEIKKDLAHLQRILIVKINALD
jgi:release factor glutamine methyltransferase